MADNLRHLPPNDDELSVKPDIAELLEKSGGVERASPELIESIRRDRGDRTRELVLAEPGSDREKLLDYFGAEASTDMGNPNLITARQNPSKAVLLEEYLHGVQVKMGIPDRLGRDYAEWHVRDFMIRNRNLVGLGEEDISRLESGRSFEAGKPDVQEAIVAEAARKAEVRAELRASLANRAEHHTTHGVGVAGVVVNAAEGNYGAAALDAASMAAENHAVQQAVAETAVKIGLGDAAKVAAKHIPIAGAVVTAGFVAYEVGAHVVEGDYKIAGAALVAGTAEAAGNFFGPLGVGDAAREAVRGGIIATGGDEYAAVQKSGLRELGEGAYAVGEGLLGKPQGKPLAEVLPPNHASLAQGADDMGERSEVARIAVERTGLAANDPANSMSLLAQQPGPRAHLLVLEDGSVQGPESGGVPFGNNPQIAAGKNGGTLGILYAGSGAMNDAQWNTVQQVSSWLGAQRQAEGLGGSVEVIAGSTTTAELLNLPTPRGPLPKATTVPQPAVAPVQNRMRTSNGM